MEKQVNNHSLQIRMTADLLARIRRAAAADGMTVSGWVKYQISKLLSGDKQP